MKIDVPRAASYKGIDREVLSQLISQWDADGEHDAYAVVWISPNLLSVGLITAKGSRVWDVSSQNQFLRFQATIYMRVAAI